MEWWNELHRLNNNSTPTLTSTRNNENREQESHIHRHRRMNSVPLNKIFYITIVWRAVNLCQFIYFALELIHSVAFFLSSFYYVIFSMLFFLSFSSINCWVDITVAAFISRSTFCYCFRYSEAVNDVSTSFFSARPFKVLQKSMCIEHVDWNSIPSNPSNQPRNAPPKSKRSTYLDTRIYVYISFFVLH